MSRHVWTVLCKTVSTDKESNNVSLFNVTEELGGTVVGEERPRSIPYQLTLVTLWTRSDAATPERDSARVRLLTPDGGEAFDANLHEVDLSQYKRARHQLAFGALPYRGPGRYEFVVELQDDAGWTEKARVPLDVTIRFEQGEVREPHNQGS